MATTEHTINDALAELLRGTRRAWRTAHVVSSENTGMLVGSNKRPDILVLEPSVSPVVIETEVTPGTTVESDAIARLGELASRFSGERGLRATPRQGLLMRSVETGDLAALAAELLSLIHI